MSITTLLNLTSVAAFNAPSDTEYDAPYTWANSKMLAPTMTPKLRSSRPGIQPAMNATG